MAVTRSPRAPGAALGAAALLCLGLGSVLVSGTVSGGSHDPHFVGNHGVRFDFNGEPGKTYCLISDGDLHLNALFKGYQLDRSDGIRTPTDLEGDRNVRTWMGELGLVWRDASGKRHSLRLVARDHSTDVSAPGMLASAIVDGATVALPTAPGPAVNVGGLELTFVGTSKMPNHFREGWALTLEGKLGMQIDVDAAMQELRLLDDAMVHFSFRMADFKASRSVHGVLGQTFRNTPAQALKTFKYRALADLLQKPIHADGDSGLGFLDGVASDYEASALLQPSCKYSMFQG